MATANFNTIRKGFRTAILGKSGVPVQALWAFEGEKFVTPDPAPAAVWVRESLNIAEENPVSIGNMQQVVGFYMAVVVVAKDSGIELLETTTKAVIDAVGTSVVQDGLEMSIERKSRAGDVLAVDQVWHSRAVRFFFRAHVAP